MPGDPTEKAFIPERDSSTCAGLKFASVFALGGFRVLLLEFQHTASRWVASFFPICWKVTSGNLPGDRPFHWNSVSIVLTVIAFS
jgi:hypothetical protein